MPLGVQLGQWQRLAGDIYPTISILKDEVFLFCIGGLSGETCFYRNVSLHQKAQLQVPEQSG
jgi:hypothetical protein